MTVRFGLVGYGVGGRLFHAPYIVASTRCELAGVVVRDTQRADAVRAEHPEATVYGSLGEMVADGIEAVTISTPPATRQRLVLEALALGVHVIADKPFAPSATAARQLLDAARTSGRLLNVFHNRRFDSDIVTALSVLQSGELGTVSRLDLRCDQDDPSTLEGGPTGGLLRDLGSHLVDQALHLLGPARSVYGSVDVAALPGGVTDVGFALTIEHSSGAHSHVSSSKSNRLVSRELRLLGSAGSYVSDYSDVQYEAILDGRRPTDAGWGVERESRWGRLATSHGGSRSVPSSRGDYTLLYDRFADAVEHGGDGPVPAEQGVAVLEVLDAARLSAFEHRVVLVGA